METRATPDAWSRLWQTFGHLLSVLLRVLFVALLAVLLGLGVYFGVPWLYRQVIQPVQSNAVMLGLLEQRVEQMDDSWTASSAAQQQRIADLESQSAGQGERIAALEAALARAEGTLGEQQAALDGLAAAVDAISADYAGVQALAALQTRVDTLQEDVTLAEQIEAQLQALERRIILTQVLQDVLKARVYLTEDNLGDAETALVLAGQHVDQAAELTPEAEREAVTALQARLLQAASRLRANPVLAAQDLESIWYDLNALISPGQ